MSSVPATHRTLRLARRPNGLPTNADWEIRVEATPSLREGEFLVRTRMVSIDPMMRGWLDEGDSSMSPVQVGEVMRAVTVGEVCESKNGYYPVGTLVQGVLGAQELAVSTGRTVTRVDPALGTLSMWLGVLGNTGMTAYFGLLEYGAPRPGDCVLVSAASGAVGSVAAQLARIAGCRVIGVAGGPEKCQVLIEDLRLDAAIDYRNDDVARTLRAVAPDGIDVYFDNVGGTILEAALDNLAFNARVVLCGGIADYNDLSMRSGPPNYLNLLYKSASMVGFVVFEHAHEYATARRRLARLVADGDVVAPETVVEGTLADFNDVFLRLFSGNKLGKLVLSLD